MSGGRCLRRAGASEWRVWIEGCDIIDNDNIAMVGANQLSTALALVHSRPFSPSVWSFPASLFSRSCLEIVPAPASSKLEACVAAPCPMMILAFFQVVAVNIENDLIIRYLNSLYTHPLHSLLNNTNRL